VPFSLFLPLSLTLVVSLECRSVYYSSVHCQATHYRDKHKAECPQMTRDRQAKQEAEAAEARERREAEAARKAQEEEEKAGGEGAAAAADAERLAAVEVGLLGATKG
jgi:hypothetical protein